MQVKELGHAVLYVSDIDRSRHFYGNVLGFKEIKNSKGGFAVYSSGRTHHELLLIQVGSDAQPIPAGRRVGLYHLGFKIGETDDELRAAMKDLAAAGVSLLGSSDHGVTHSLYLADPDGNEIELYIDVQPELWREDPSAMLSPTRALQL